MSKINNRARFKDNFINQQSVQCTKKKKVWHIGAHKETAKSQQVQIKRSPSKILASEAPKD